MVCGCRKEERRAHGALRKVQVRRKVCAKAVMPTIQTFESMKLHIRVLGNADNPAAMKLYQDEAAPKFRAARWRPRRE